MKVTSFEISKKLADIGFKAQPIQAYRTFFPLEGSYGWLPDMANKENWTPAYDLETILDAFPAEIRIEKVGNLLFSWTIKKNAIFYSAKVEGIGEIWPLMECEGASMVDRAARLLIKLHEAGLVKFKEE